MKAFDNVLIAWLMYNSKPNDKNSDDFSLRLDQKLEDCEKNWTITKKFKQNCQVRFYFRDTFSFAEHQ